MKYLVCNFKNKLTYEEIIRYNKELGKVSTKTWELVLVPSFPFLPLFNKTGYKMGAQDITSFMDKTLTGEVNGEQLESIGVSYVIVGHSERRELKHEINIDFINKINNALEAGLKVIYCIGESLQDKESGNTFDVLEKQISEVLNNVDIRNIIVAYEPVWAIGTGIVPSKQELTNTIEYIKDILNEKYDTNFKVLYGGSVNESNISELNSIKQLDGFLVGGFSLQVSNVELMLKLLDK